MRRLIQFSAFLLLFLSAHFVRAGEVDPRFEGIWVGVETFQVPASLAQIGSAPFQKPVVIAIGDSGKIIGVVQGFCYGRYEVWGDRSSGNRLQFKLLGFHNALLNAPVRSLGTLTLSADGNSITEKGFGALPGIPRPVICVITATLHRQGKK
jgi:hypothetical protein